MQPKLSIPTVLDKITQHYSPKLVVARLDDAYEVKVARTKGDFVWHSHPENDELFYVLSGSLTIQIENGGEVEDVLMSPGEIFVIPRAVRHRPMGDAEIMLIERAGTVNTGDAAKSNLTKEVEDFRSGK